MRRILVVIIIWQICTPMLAQNATNELVSHIQVIKSQQGDSIARNYLDSKKDSLDRIGETSSYVLLWGLLTSNMWNANPSNSLTKEYKEYLDAVIDDEIKGVNYSPTRNLLSSLWQLASDYYKILYNEGDKDHALVILKCIHNWFVPYDDLRNTVGYAQSLLDLCRVLRDDLHKYNESEPYCKEYVQVAKSVFGEKSAQYAVSLYNLACLPQLPVEEQTAMIKEAITIYKQFEGQYPQVYAQMKRDYEMMLAKTQGLSNTKGIDIKEGKIITLQECTQLVVAGRGAEALTSLNYYKDRLLNDEHLDTLVLTSVINYLIQAYMQSGDLASAQREINQFNDSIGISTANIPVEYVQIFYSNAGLVEYWLKNYPLALRFSQAACKLFEQTGGYGIEYSKVLANIAMIYAAVGQDIDTQYNLDAKWYIDEAVSIFEERVGPLREHGDIGITLLNDKALVYDAIGDRAGAISALESIVNNFSGDIEVKDAWTLAVNNLSAMYMKDGHWQEGAKLLEGLKSGNDERNYMFAQNLALCYLYANDNQKSVSHLQDMNRYALSNIEKIFSNFAGVERENYWSGISRELVLINNLIADHTTEPQAICIAYNNALFCKNLLIKSSRLIDNYISQSSNPELRQLGLEYNDLKNRLAYKSENDSVKNALSREITRIEKQVLDSMGNLGQNLLSSSSTWEDVRDNLNEDEIAIEYCYAPRMEHYPDIQPYYGAFILRKDFSHPLLLSLEHVDTVETAIDMDDIDSYGINKLYNATNSFRLYQMLLGKIEPYLKGINKIYYSPTGYLSELNFDVLCDGDGNLMNDKYGMIRVSSTGNIADIKASNNAGFQTSVLYGNIEYDESPMDMADASKSYSSFTGSNVTAELALRSENERGRWGAIPFTKDEVEAIDSLFLKNGIKTSLLEENIANEESFKALNGNSPDIIHMSTHGFAIYTPQRSEGNKFVLSTSVYSQKESYMMWSGLILAGGNNAWHGTFDLTNVEDGILTAEEISRLDLSNTKLAVLSACETARGKIDPVDGVLGLQRAFKIAGVQTIVMSLWKVNDVATSLLMTHFYMYLTNGIERHQALWKAMMDVKEKYSDPYYWAGFIILD